MKTAMYIECVGVETQLNCAGQWTPRFNILNNFAYMLIMYFITFRVFNSCKHGQPKCKCLTGTGTHMFHHVFMWDSWNDVKYGCNLMFGCSRLSHVRFLFFDSSCPVFLKSHSASFSPTGRKGQSRREGEPHHHQLVLSVRSRSSRARNDLSSHLSLLTGTSGSGKWRGCEGREGLPCKCLQPPCADMFYLTTEQVCVQLG